jgi:RHS repeat-associated protein
VRLLTDELGAVTDTYEYGGYGEVLRATGTTENPYLYRGESWDAELGLQYLRARYYEPETGRFLSTDPFEGMVERPVSRHRYLYGNANPVVFEDPSGEVSAVAGELQASNIASILAKISLPIPGLVRAGGLATAFATSAYNNFRGNLREWSGKAYAGTVPAPAFDVWPALSSLTGTKVTASTTFNESTNSGTSTVEVEADWVLGSLDFSFPLSGAYSIPARLPIPTQPDSFKAYTKREYGASPILLTPFTVGIKLSATMFSGFNTNNASLKTFLMGVGFAGIASSNTTYPTFSESIYGGLSLYIPGARYENINETPE